VGLERAAWLERRFGAQVQWHPYYLHPEYPAEGITRRALEERYGEGFHHRVQQMIEEAGFRYSPPDIIPNTLPSLYLGELARDEGGFDQVHHLLFTTYWSEGKNIGDPDVLAEVAEKAGLDVGRFAEAVQNGVYGDRIIGSTQTAHEMGVTGVPAWLIDKKLLVVGAQPHEAFDSILQEQGHSPRTAPAA